VGQAQTMRRETMRREPATLAFATLSFPRHPTRDNLRGLCSAFLAQLQVVPAGSPTENPQWSPMHVSV